MSKTTVLGLAALVAVGGFAATPAEILWTKPICVETNRYIGWPTVCRRANGELLAAFSGDREEHVCPFGKVQLVRSADGGETWSAPETIRNTCLDDRDAGIIELKDGTLVVFTFSSVYYATRGNKRYNRICHELPKEKVREEIGYWSLRSTDGGRTWEKPVRMKGSAPHGGIQLKDGRLLMVGYSHNQYGDRWPEYLPVLPRPELTVETSSDGARSWRVIAKIEPPERLWASGLCEPHVVELDDGTLVAQFRYHDERDGTLQSESTDGGKTWSELHETGIVGFPPHLLRLADGRILSSYGRRDEGHYGEYVAVSSDGGKSWAVDAFALDVNPPCFPWDLGYPSTVQFPDGTFLTTYYQSPDRETKPRLMATKWRMGAEHPLVDCVDPMIGAITLSGYGGHGLGKTFPGAATPFGMVQISPDTITGGDNGPGYSYHHETIEGFSMTHMSGIGWSGDLGNFHVMPADGPARFSHSNEVAKAGYYSVALDEPKVRVCLTADPGQCGTYKFTYPKSEKSVLKIDLARRIGELWRAKKFSHQALSFEGDHAIFGEIACDHRDGGWGSGEGLVDYTLYYYAWCSKPLSRGVVTGAPSNTVFRMEFPTQEGEEVRLDVWISYESVQKARALSRMKRKALIDPWAPVFDKIDVKGGTERQRRIFATAVYHACLDPRWIDLPGQSRTVFSGWDVFRTEMPFLTLFFPEVVTDTVSAMMGVMESGRRDTLPVWDLFGCKSGCMIGNPLIPVILTAQEAGLGGIDYAKALDLAVKTTEKRGNLACGYTPDSLSETLEYCFDDWCVGEIARRLGKDDVAARFADRARWYTNCWDRTVGWMRARTRDGGWLEPWKGETVHGQGCVESNPLQQGWFVPHDVEGLVRLVGGREKTLAKLEEFFEKAPDDFLWGDYYNHPNEPSHHIVFLFSELGRPDLTQKWTRRILEKAYNDDVRGLCGNDDVGQMSAWYVMAALGFSPMCPGSGRWTLTAPLFPEARIRIFGDHELTIVAKGAEDPRSVYVRSVRLDGREFDRPFVTTDELRRGDRIEFMLEKRSSPAVASAAKF